MSDVIKKISIDEIHKGACSIKGCDAIYALNKIMPEGWKHIWIHNTPVSLLLNDPCQFVNNLNVDGALCPKHSELLKQDLRVWRVKCQI